MPRMRVSAAAALQATHSAAHRLVHRLTNTNEPPILLTSTRRPEHPTEPHKSRHHATKSHTLLAHDRVQGRIWPRMSWPRSGGHVAGRLPVGRSALAQIDKQRTEL